MSITSLWLILKEQSFALGNIFRRLRIPCMRIEKIRLCKQCIKLGAFRTITRTGIITAAGSQIIIA